MAYSLFTERRALETMFNNLEEDKRQIKREARADIESIEKRQFEMLDRIKRLDDIERESIDGEQVLRQLAATTQQLKDLLPDVHVKDVIEKVADKIANNPEAAAALDMSEEIDHRQEQIQRAAREQQLNSKPAAKPAPERKKPAGYLSKEQGAQLLEEILKEAGAPITATKIGKQIYNKTGRTFNNIHGALLRWIEQSDLNIVKKGAHYSIEEIDNNEQKAANE